MVVEATGTSTARATEASTANVTRNATGTDTFRMTDNLLTIKIRK